jgi:hypothetical protein
MAKKAKGFGTNLHVKTNRRKRPGRHSKKHKGKKGLDEDKDFRYKKSMTQIIKVPAQAKEIVKNKRTGTSVCR